eukprot:765988-Hanusia_phi.AAC.22
MSRAREEMRNVPAAADRSDIPAALPKDVQVKKPSAGSVPRRSARVEQNEAAGAPKLHRLVSIDHSMPGGQRSEVAPTTTEPPPGYVDVTILQVKNIPVIPLRFSLDV